jgi:signal transduction histidine kinase
MLRWLGVTSGFVALTLSLTGIGFVDSAANRQVAALLVEELDEVRVSFAHRRLDATSFLSLSHELSTIHPGSNFAWRVWAPDGESLIGEFGEGRSLRRGAPAVSPLERTVAVAGRYRWRSTRLSSGEIVGLILDARPHRVFVDRYILVAIAIVVMGFGGIFLVGQAFSTKVSRLLSRIALRARQAQASGGSVVLTLDDLPEEIVEVAEALEEMLHNIRSETEASRILIAGMAHELRAPIQNLIGETEVTLLTERPAQRYRSVLASHLDELRYLGDAVHNLVALCSARQAAEAKETEWFNLFREARYRLEREVNRAERCGVEMVFRMSGDPSVRGDREAILSAIRNLASNALDWTPRDGRIEIDFCGTADSLTITVDDSGPGVPEEARQKIFEAFYRGPAAEGKRIGYGLGLALTQAAMEAQGGTIAVGDSPLGGARFCATLPRGRPGQVRSSGAAQSG